MRTLLPALPRRDTPMLLMSGAALVTAATLIGLVTKTRWLEPATALAVVSSASAASRVGVTEIAVGSTILHEDVSRFGINLGGQTFYDSGQMMKNLVFRNPGFEGETWQAFLHCKTADASTCIDDNPYSPWPQGFLNQATYEVISGKAAGRTGSIRASTPAQGGLGIKAELMQPAPGLAAGDFLLIRMEKPGDASAGWWTNATGGATINTEFDDLSPQSPGKQALRLNASAPNQFASVSSFFDSTEGRSFLQLYGTFTLRFRARWLSGGHAMPVSLSRFDKVSDTSHTFLRENTQLTAAWHDYAITFSANEDGTARGTIALTFATLQNAFLLDDVSLTPVDTPGNPTAFRDEVVDTLRELRPGIIRFMDSGTSFGSTLDDLLAPPFARRRGGWHLTSAKAEDIPIGLHEALVLAQAVHADPWYTLPGTFSPAEMSHLIEYLAGPPTTPYGAIRAKRGQAAPWTTVFQKIHLEFGNEMWNAGDFGGEALPSPTVYAARATAVLKAAQTSTFFEGDHFDLIADGQAGNTWLTEQLLNHDLHANSIDFGPYLFGQLDNASSDEAVFGAMFSMPEQQDTPQASSEGLMAQQVRLARSAKYPAAPAVYEVNLSTNVSTNRSVSQQQINAIVPSIGGAIAVADHMLLMLRDLGITNQCLFALPEYTNRFTEPDQVAKTTPLWGSVVDMGGPTNLRRPTYLALKLMNQAILRNELTTQISGTNPTWDQPASTNGPTPAITAHLIQSLAFADQEKRSLVLLNLSRTIALPVTFSGTNAPKGIVTQARLTSKNLTDTNEQSSKVTMKTEKLSAFDPAAAYQLPPFSMTVLSWEVSQ